MPHSHEQNRQPANDQHRPARKGSWWRTFPGIVTAVILASLGYLLIVDHREHLADNWFLLLFLLCPLMHVFMHGGHGHNHKDGD